MLQYLPNQEEAKTILYYAIINSLNQFENQNDNQIENQFENAYVSVSDSLSVLSKSIYNLLLKSIVWKEFSNNYGGKRENAGRKSKNNQDENQLEKQDENQESGNLDNKHNLNYETLFFEFWQNYIPVKCDGRFVDKGSKKLSFEKFTRILKSGVKYEDIISGLHAYLNHCRENKQLTCTVPVFLNQQRWTNDYNTATIIAEDTKRERQEPKSILETYAEIAAEYEKKNSFL